MKLEVYKRLCEHAYPNQKDFPDTAKEAKTLTESQRKLEMKKEEMTLKSFGLPEGTVPLEEGVPAPEGGATALLEGMDHIFVTTSTLDAVFASWSRIAAMTGKMETMACHRRPLVSWCCPWKSLPADTEGWVQLQFYTGQAWVSEKQGKVCAPFLPPSCNFPPPHLEDNKLCPKCIHRENGKERERNIDVTETHQLVASRTCPNQDQG